jgi:hypothetical protein
MPKGGLVKIVDHAGETLMWVPPEKAEALIAAGQVEQMGTRRKLRALRVRGAEPDMGDRRFQVRRPGLGPPHRRETYENPRGVWTLDSLRGASRKYFTRVMDDCKAA